jgi:hypothetical protein
MFITAKKNLSVLEIIEIFLDKKVDKGIPVSDVDDVQMEVMGGLSCCEQCRFRLTATEFARHFRSRTVVVECLEQRAMRCRAGDIQF